ncbi:hypothetical protein BLX24_14000 [Arsenicibacter rosenii]|uniref:DUF4190 domain-containing protein n=1 Tax=Arsenicibacter rosenii TaxID=1750698 RepID=A0A1S2VIU6_9BACT|nr:hypothetical protein BLX24_14000 [Arsenicibacter rosenii]
MARNTVSEAVSAPVRTLSPVASISTRPDSVVVPAAPALVIQPSPRHLQNPDYSHRKPRKAWLQQTGILSPVETGYVREKPVVAGKRRTPVLAHGAFAGSAVSCLVSTLSVSGGWIWVVVTTLPLLSALIGVAGLTKIQKNREQYSGKAWAISAILLGTGVIGMAWVALAALASSKAFWG